MPAHNANVKMMEVNRNLGFISSARTCRSVQLIGGSITEAGPKRGAKKGRAFPSLLVFIVRLFSIVGPYDKHVFSSSTCMCIEPNQQGPRRRLSKRLSRRRSGHQ